MLKKVLRALVSGSVDSFSDIARSLDVDKGVVEQIIAQLVQMGYLKAVENSSCDSGSCGGSCSGCACSGGESSVQNRFYSLTEKGLKAVERQESQVAE